MTDPGQLSMQDVFTELADIPEVAPWLQVAHERALRKKLQQRVADLENASAPTTPPTPGGPSGAETPDA